MSLPIFLQLLFAGVSIGSLYALVAVALVIPFKSSGVLNFGQGEMVTLGAYVALTLSMFGHLSYAPVVVLTLLIAGALGVVFERIVIRPIVAAPEFTIVLSTFALGLVVKSLIRIYWQDDVYPLPVPFSTEPLVLGGVHLNPVDIAMIVVAIVAMALLGVLFRFTKAGKAMRAVSQNRQAAQLMGISVSRVYAVSWALSIGLGALVGILSAPVTGIYPELGQIILKAFVAAVIGGFSSFPGVGIGGLLLGVVETFSGALGGGALKNVIAFVLLIALLLVRPHGLFGSAGARRV